MQLKGPWLTKGKNPAPPMCIAAEPSLKHYHALVSQGLLVRRCKNGLTIAAILCCLWSGLLHLIEDSCRDGRICFHIVVARRTLLL